MPRGHYSRKTVYEAIDKEREYQDGLWGALDATDENDLPAFLGYMWIQYEKAQEANLVNIEASHHQIRKVAALAVAALEYFGVAFRGTTKPRALFLRLIGAVFPRFKVKPLNTDWVFKDVDAPVHRDTVRDAIDRERDYQDSLGPDRCIGRNGGNTIEQNPLSLGATLTMLRYYLRQADEAWTMKPGDDAALHSVRKIAAICVRHMETYGPRYR